MVFDSLLNKEVRLLKKSEKLYVKGEKTLPKDSSQAHSLFLESLENIKANSGLIKDKKKDFSELLANLGDQLTSLDDFKNGEYALKMAINLDSKNINAYVFYARALKNRKNYDLALSTVDKAIAMNRKSKGAWETKAEIYEAMGDVDEALKIYLNLINLYPEELKYYEKYLKYKPNDEKILLKKGILLYDKGNFDSSANTLQTVVNINPNNKEAYLYLGAAYEKIEKYEEAINAFKKVISIDSEDKHAWVNLAVIYKKRGEYEDALKAVKEGIKIDPNDSNTWALRAEIEYDTENYDDALESANQALSLKKDVDVLLLKREILKKKYVEDEMAKTCHNLIEMGKRDLDIYYDLAEAYFKMKNYDMALQVIDSILNSSPHHLPTLILQKNTLMAMGRWEKVITTCEKILEIDPKNVETMVDMAKAYENMEKYESALHFLKKATQIDSKNIELWKMQKEMAKKVNKPNEVVNACVGITGIVEDFDAYYDMARAYYTLGRFAEAKKAMDKALRIKETGNAWNLNGMINYKLNDLEGAKKSFERATEIEGGVKKYWSNLGWVLEKLEKYEEALKAFDKAIEIDPKDMRIWYEKGLCLEKLGEWEESLKCFDEALKIDSKFTKALMEKGEVLLQLEHLDEALKAFNSLLKLEPANHLALYKRAFIEFKKGEREACEKDIEEALKYEKDEKYLELKKDCCKSVENWDCVVEVSRSILDINGRNMNTYRDLAMAYINLGKVDSAITTYRRALEIFPDNISFMYELKDIFIKEKRYPDLIDIGKKILSIEPEDFQTLLDMGRAYMEMQRYDDAEDYLLRALNVKMTKEVYDSLGELYYKKKDYQGAIKYYADSLKIEADPEIYYKMALAQYRIGEMDFALTSIRKAIKRKKAAKYYLMASKIYSERGDMNNALKYGKKALNIDDTPEIRVLLGKILVDSGDYVEAISTLKAPAKEGNERAMELLAYALEKEDRQEDAKEIYRKILEKNKENVNAYLGLGRINMANEKYEDAKDAYLMAYKINPHNRELCENLAFVYEKLGDLNESLKYVDLAIEMEPENKHLWTTKGQLLMKLEKYEDAKRAFEKAVSLDAEFQPAVEGLKDAERILENKEIEKFARDVLVLEFKTGKKVTKKEAFKKLDIPLAILPKVFKYIREEEPLNVGELSDEEKKKFEKATYVLAKKIHKIENLSLGDIVGNTNLSVSKAKRLLKYIDYCMSHGVPEEVTPEEEKLVKRAIEMDIKNKSLLNLMLNLDIGICTAKKIRKILKDLEEDEEEQEDFEEDTAEENNVEDREEKVNYSEEELVEEEEESEQEEDLRL